MSGGVPAGELKPCPFCGGGARLDIGKQVFEDAEVSCDSCGCQGPNYDDGFGREDNARLATAAWNTRATPTPPIEGRDADVERGHCTMGVGCDEAGVCYAAANGDPSQCPKTDRPVASTSADAERECQAVWRCAIGDVVGAMDMLRTEWINSRRKHERKAGAKLGAVLDLVWAARDPAAKSYSAANKNGRVMVDRIRAALQALGERG